jgi:hypothetical protein
MTTNIYVCLGFYAQTGDFPSALAANCRFERKGAVKFAIAADDLLHALQPIPRIRHPKIWHPGTCRRRTQRASKRRFKT